MNVLDGATAAFIESRTSSNYINITIGDLLDRVRSNLIWKALRDFGKWVALWERKRIEWNKINKINKIVNYKFMFVLLFNRLLVSFLGTVEYLNWSCLF